MRASCECMPSCSTLQEYLSADIVRELSRMQSFPVYCRLYWTLWTVARNLYMYRQLRKGGTNPSAVAYSDRRADLSMVLQLRLPVPSSLDHGWISSFTVPIQVDNAMSTCQPTGGLLWPPDSAIHSTGICAIDGCIHSERSSGCVQSCAS